MTDKAGKIVAFVDIPAPYEKEIMESIASGAIAVVVYRDRSDTPGQGMYYRRIGYDEPKLTIPVVEAFEQFKPSTSLHNHFPASAEIQVSLWPQENRWKKANDHGAFQIVWNVILSAMQVAIILIGLLRLQLWASSEAGLLAIGPTCIILECISSAIRCAETFVDPFLSFRTMPSPVGETLITTSFPFQFASGILLTFYWAETLMKNKIKAAPFVSEYKKSAITVVVLLFLFEIATSTARGILPIASLNPVYFSQALYVIVAAGLTVSYTICAIQIRNRLSASNAPRRSIRNLTLRFLMSTSGYIMFVILVILLIPYLGEPWGWKIILNLTFLAADITALLQVYSFIPPKGVSSHSKVGGAPTSSSSLV